MQLPDLAELEAAARLIAPFVPPTPQYRWPQLCDATGADLWVKHENHTALGAFKVRGGLVWFADLKRRLPGARHVVAASKGNHGQSVAFAAASNGVTATIIVPHGNSIEKNAAMRALGAELIEYGDDFQTALDRARAVADETGAIFVPSFDRSLVCGVATGTLELLRTVPDLDMLYIPIGLGSAICGAIAVRDALGLSTRIIGVVAEAAPAYAASFEAGYPVPMAVGPTLADGLACSTPDPAAFPIIRAGAERIVPVNERDIAIAMRLYFSATHNVAEGAGAAALAAILDEPHAVRGRRVAVVLSGGNIDTARFGQILALPRGSICRSVG